MILYVYDLYMTVCLSVSGYLFVFLSLLINPQTWISLTVIYYHEELKNFTHT